MMPKLDGIGAVKALKADPGLPFIPVILVTARADARDVIAGLEAGADDYLTKPVDQAALMARVRAMLRIKALHDTVQEQARRLEDQGAELALWNKELEARVQAQLGEIERMGTLKRFLAPQLAEMIVSQGDVRILEAHRRDIVVVFCDLRGFTAFAETAEPEEVIDLLREYHDALGPLVTRSEGRSTISPATASWCSSTTRCRVPTRPSARSRWPSRCARRWRGCRPGGAGAAARSVSASASPRATRHWARSVSPSGSTTPRSARSCNLASRLCDAAADGQILVSKRVAGAVEGTVTLEEIGDLALKGLSQAVAVYNVAGE